MVHRAGWTPHPPAGLGAAYPSARAPGAPAESRGAGDRAASQASCPTPKSGEPDPQVRGQAREGPQGPGRVPPAGGADPQGLPRGWGHRDGLGAGRGHVELGCGLSCCPLLRAVSWGATELNPSPPSWAPKAGYNAAFPTAARRGRPLAHQELAGKAARSLPRGPRLGQAAPRPTARCCLPVVAAGSPRAPGRGAAWGLGPRQTAGHTAERPRYPPPRLPAQSQGRHQHPEPAQQRTRASAH